MIHLSAVLHKSRSLLPDRQSVLEASGFLLLGLGLFLALAIFTYNPHDYLSGTYKVSSIKNMAGPVGAWSAHQILGYFGVVGLLWPVMFIAWGVLVTLGFTTAPRARRVVGLLWFMSILAGICQVQGPAWALREPSFGFGGSIGKGIGLSAYSGFGYGGTLIILIVMGFIGLVLSGNLALSTTRFQIIRFWNFGSVLLRDVYGRLNEKSPSDEELIKDALLEEVRRSKSVGKVWKHSDNGMPIGSTTESRVKKSRSKSKKQNDEVNISKLMEEAVDEANESSSSNNAEVEDVNTLDFYYNGKSHSKPVTGMFSKSSKPLDRSAEFEKMGKKLTAQLAEFKVIGKVRKIVEGPVVTTFEFEPVPGTKVSKITSLSADLARLLGAKSLRILAPIPGKKVVGFEVPNAERRMIGFADLVAHRNLKSQKINLPVAMGVDTFGKVVIEDLTKMPHLLVAGSTGSGKSVFMNTLIGSLIARHSAKDLRFVMIDPKMVELAAYNDLPHMACPVITDPSTEAKEKLDALVAEMEDRFKKMSIVGARNVDGFNELVKKSKRSQYPKFTDKWQPMPYIVLIIDELADMMMVLGKDAEIPITRLAQKARAAGIHLVIATQRPSADVVTGLIKANFPTRVAFRVLSGTDSRTILDTSGAEGLIGQGDMLFLNAAGLRRMHGAFLSDNEVHQMVKVTTK